MQYFKNADLTKMYPISEKAVRNWIAAAKEGKLELTLHEEAGRKYIANTIQNTAIIERLVNERRKYVNSKGRKTTQPTAKFYKILSKDQIFDTITHLEAYNEIPLKYSYFNDGADYWDKYSHKLSNESIPNILNRTIELLDISTNYLFNLLKDCSKVNVIDIGPGNGQPVQKFLESLLKTGKLSRYIAIDISPSMLNKVEENMGEWFGKDFPYEGHVRDVAHERFKDVLGNDAIGADNDKVCNLVLLLGSTLSNFRAPYDVLRLVHNSMGTNDLLVYSSMLDAEATKRYFDFGVTTAPQANNKAEFRSLLMINYLGIDESMYEIEWLFNEEENSRVGQIKLKHALTIEFQFEDLSHRVDFDKGDAIVFWKHRHQDAASTMNQLEETGFGPLQVSQSDDHEYILAVAEVKK